MKRFLLLVLCLSIISSMNVSALGWTQTITPYFNSLTLYVNGKELPGDTILYQGTTYIPIRAAATALGGDVQWDESTRSAYITTKRTDYIADVIKWCDNVDDFIYYMDCLESCSLEYCYTKNHRDGYYELILYWLKRAKDCFNKIVDTEMHLKLRYVGVDIDSNGFNDIVDELFRYLNDFETYATKIVEASGSETAVYELMFDKYKELDGYCMFRNEWKHKALSALYNL